MIKQDILENQVNSIYLGIGSNVGNRKENIEKAKILLNKNNIRILNSSSFYESLSWPNSKNPKFLNIVVRIKSNLTPLKLILKCKEIEIAVAKGKKQFDKRATKKNRDWNREKARHFRKSS